MKTASTSKQLAMKLGVLEQITSMLPAQSSDGQSTANHEIVDHKDGGDLLGNLPPVLLESAQEALASACRPEYGAAYALHAFIARSQGSTPP